MRVIKIIILILFMIVPACTQTQFAKLPAGISLIEGIDPLGLQFPIWSPDGKKIVASYVIEAMPDIAGLFGAEPRHDIVIIDTELWESTIIASQDSGTLNAEGWFPDSTGFAMLWSDGFGRAEMYLFSSDGTKLRRLSSNGSLSPDMAKTAHFEDTHVSIIDIQTQVVTEFEVPFRGNWYVDSWSPDMRKLVLTYQSDESERFYNIYLLDLHSGTFTQFTDDNDFYKYSPTISPNGELIAYSAHRFYENEIEDKLIISTLDQSCEWIMPVKHINSFAWSPDSQRMFLGGNDGVYVADLNIVIGTDFEKGYHCP